MHPKEIFDKIAQYFSSDRYESEYGATRQYYLNMIGSFGEDEQFFENQMTRFLEWYLIDRSLRDTGIPPCRLYRLAFSDQLSKEHAAMLLSLEESIHSLFQVRSVQARGTVVEDILENKEYVLDQQFYPEFRIGDIIDARLYYSEATHHLTDSAWMYPSELKPWVLQTVKKFVGKNKDQFLVDMAYMKSKRDRFPHVPIEQIFHWDHVEKDRQNYLKTKTTGF